MIAHASERELRLIVAFDVKAADVFDLRAPHALEEVQRAAGDPLADWQGVAAQGGEPTSWRARDWIEGIGAKGLIDPSRKAPGLWHLVLFSWNVAGSPSVGYGPLRGVSRHPSLSSSPRTGSIEFGAAQTLDGSSAIP